MIAERIVVDCWLVSTLAAEEPVAGTARHFKEFPDCPTTTRGIEEVASDYVTSGW